jgi:anti-sigma factor RsiW
VVARHRLDVPVDVASADPARVQQFLASRVGPKLRVPHLEQTGFGLQGGRVVDVNERRGAQLVYTGGFGQRISVVALPDPDGAFARSVRAPLATSADGLAVRMLAGDGALYGVVGDVDDARIESVVNAIER